MDIKEYDNNRLIEFYFSNGLEFNDSKKYFGINTKSYVISENGKIVGAISISKYKDKNFIEAIAVDKKYRNKGNGKKLLDKALSLLDSPIYTISKNDKFYLNNGFKYTDEDIIDNNCKKCNKYGKTCFPKAMKYE